MAWNVTYRSPVQKGNQILVEAEFWQDGVLKHVESYYTNQAQPDGWPGELVKRTLKALQELPAMLPKIVEGPVTLPSDPVVTPTDPLVEAYQKDLARWRLAKEYGQFRPAILNSAKFIALEKRLNDNFKVEYLDLG